MQLRVFLLSYGTNLLSLLGLSFYFVTSTFYDDDASDGEKADKLGVTLPEIQVILLLTAIMYIVLGSTVEYIRHVELKIVVPIIGFFGLLKIVVSSLASKTHV